MSMFKKSLRNIAAIGALALAAGLPAAHAATLAADGQWAEFSVAKALTGNLNWADFDGQALSFEFQVAEGFQATLTAVGAGFSGDRYTVADQHQVLGITSVGSDGDSNGTPTFDFDEALANSAFSRAVYTLGAGQHSISGFMSTSLVSAEFGPLEASNGALRLSIAEVSAVPEPSSPLTLLAGLSVLSLLLGRKSRGNQNP